jgi:guanine deaminase
MADQIIRGPLLIPERDGSVAFHTDGILVADAAGILQFAGPVEALRGTGFWQVLEDADRRPVSQHAVRNSDGIMLPPLLDIHTHIPQHPIRGRFCEGVADDAPSGKLLNGLQRNVFPAEARCDSAHHAELVVREFLADTLSHGVIGGAAYMTPSVIATEKALSILPESWSVGLVLMDQNCPENLRTDESNLQEDVQRLAKKFGRRLIITDRFAVAVSTPLRRRAAALAARFGLRTQTHLNEQVAEKQLVEMKLYSAYSSYTDVYLRDGLLEHSCIAAHCIHMTDDEWKILSDTGSVIAHCPTSNLLLGSGAMSLDQVLDRQIPYAIATDVGASPTVSMLAEMKRFLQVHRGASNRATAAEALFRSTRASADLLGISSQFGRLEPGMPMSFIEVTGDASAQAADAAIQSLLPADVDHPANTVNRVTIHGRTAYQRSGQHA